MRAVAWTLLLAASRVPRKIVLQLPQQRLRVEILYPLYAIVVADAVRVARRVVREHTSGVPSAVLVPKDAHAPTHHALAYQALLVRVRRRRGVRRRRSKRGRATCSRTGVNVPLDAALRLL
eukprot:395657-Pleurochrysis_carterae.AAC.12